MTLRAQLIRQTLIKMSSLSPKHIEYVDNYLDGMYLNTEHPLFNKIWTEHIEEWIQEKIKNRATSIERWRQNLDNIQYGYKFLDCDVNEELYKDGFLVILPNSDDLLEFRGVLYGESEHPTFLTRPRPGLDLSNKKPNEPFIYITCSWDQDDGWIPYLEHFPFDLTYFTIMESETDKYGKGVIIPVEHILRTFVNKR